MMTAPFIFISTGKLKNGKLNEFKDYMSYVVEIVEANEPRLLGFAAYVSEDGTNATTVQIHSDADSLVFHLQVMREKIESAFEQLDTESITFCGEMNEEAISLVEDIAGSGVSLRVNPLTLGGFTRFQGG